MVLLLLFFFWRGGGFCVTAMTFIVKSVSLTFYYRNGRRHKSYRLWREDVSSGNDRSEEQETRLVKGLAILIDTELDNWHWVLSGLHQTKQFNSSRHYPIPTLENLTKITDHKLS